MEEAKPLTHIQTYPIVYIKKEDLDDTIHTIDEKGKNLYSQRNFDDKGNVIPIIATSYQSIYGGFFMKDIVAMVRSEPALGERLEVGIFYKRDEMDGRGGHNYSGTGIKTREDEKIVLVYTFASGKSNGGPNDIEKMAVSFITNYGNIISGIVGNDIHTNCFQRINGFSYNYTYKEPYCSFSISGQASGRNDSGGAYTRNIRIELIEKPFPERQCYVPQLFVDVIATFLQYTNRSCSEGSLNVKNKKETDKLLVKFKELCYNFTTQSKPDTEQLKEDNKQLQKTIEELKISKDEEIRRLKEELKLSRQKSEKLMDREDDIRALKEENSKLKKTVDKFEEAYDKLETSNEALEEEIKDLKEELFGLKKFYNIPLAFRFRK